MVKPYKTLFILLLIIVIALLPTLFFPKKGVRLGTVTLNYPNIEDIFNLDSSIGKTYLNPDVAFLDRMVDSSFNANLIPIKHSAFSLIADTVTHNDTIQPVDSLKAFSADYLKSKINRLEFADSTNRSLSFFFESLKNKKYNKKAIRILHYGDSQIEGDRITSYFRSRLQTKFGGGGIGLVHALPQNSETSTLLQTTSSNWEKITLSDHDKSLAGVNRYGALGGFSSFTSSKSFFSKGTNEAWIKFKRVGGVSRTARRFDRIRIFYGFNPKPFIVELFSDGATNDAELISNTYKLATISWDIKQTTNQFDINFKGDGSPLVYGISLETEKGIVVDNVPLRGSSGIDFTKTDMGFMTDMLRQLNAKLIILQFGVNVVPRIVDSYKYYEVQLYNQIKALQTALPEASIIVIGVSDVARKEGLRYTSYPNIEMIRDAQKNAAFKAGIAFWDCYKAMGGKNSMAAWQAAKPPLASKDFIHFTYRGANLIAEMFYAALISEYEQYLKNNEIPKKSGLE